MSSKHEGSKSVGFSYGVDDPRSQAGLKALSDLGRRVGAERKMGINNGGVLEQGKITHIREPRRIDAMGNPIAKPSQNTNYTGTPNF